jgi:hypothetical protein
MPKKIHSNPKAEAARERKEEVKKAKKSAEETAKENAKWADEGSTAAEQRRREKAAKDAEEARKRAEKKALQAKEEAEAAKLHNKAKGISNAEKITRAQLLRQQEELDERRRQQAEAEKLAAKKLVVQEELTPNLNRAISEQEARDAAQYGEQNIIRASGIDNALGAVSGGVLVSAAAASSVSAAAAAVLDSHPEKRMKSAYAEYEERYLPIVREENPHLKLSQYRELVFKQWQKVRHNSDPRPSRQDTGGIRGLG